MKRKPRFFIGFLAAALTFGTLMATVGPQRFNHKNRHCHKHQCDEQKQQEAAPNNH